MHLGARDRRVETTGHNQFTASDLWVTARLIERIHDPRADVMRLACSEIGDPAASGYAVDAFEVVLVVERMFRAGLQNGDVERKAHPVVGQQHPHAGPFRVRYGAVTALEVIEVSDDHEFTPLRLFYSRWPRRPRSRAYRALHRARRRAWSGRPGISPLRHWHRRFR